MTSPVIRSASSAPRRKVSVARSTSTSASRIGLPASSAMSRPSSSRRALMPGADLAQDPAALVGRQLAGDLEGGDGGLDGLLVLRLGGVVGRAGGRRRVGRVVDDRGRRATRPSGRRGRSDAAWCRRRWSSARLLPMGYVGIVQPAPAPPADPPRIRRWPDRPPCETPSGSSPARASGSRSSTPARRSATTRTSSVEADRAADGAPARPPGPAVGGGEALGPRRPPGDRRRRQGRHDRQGHGGVQPAGLPGHVVQGADRRGARPRLPVAGPQAHARARARSAIFNRSHYEDVLVVRVHDLVPKAVWSKRYDQINDFERMLADERHDDRQVLPVDRPRRAARAVPGALRRPDEALEVLAWATSRSASSGTTTRPPSTRRSRRRRPPWAPWYVIPANRNWFRNLAVATILADTMAGLKPAYPAAAGPAARTSSSSRGGVSAAPAGSAYGAGAP